MTELVRVEPRAEIEVADTMRERASEVLSQLKSLKSSLVVNLLHMGDLLLEVKQNNYHLILGHSDFQSWLDNSGLDIKIAHAYDLMRVVSKAKAVGIERPQLEQCNISALKEIMRLSPDTEADKIKELVDYAKDHKVSETKKLVDQIKIDKGEELYTLKAFRISNDVLENVVEPAIEKFHLDYGQVINSETNEVVEPSDGKFLEIACAEYLGG
jgi:hypothetical protein